MQDDDRKPESTSAQTGQEQASGWRQGPQETQQQSAQPESQAEQAQNAQEPTSGDQPQDELARLQAENAELKDKVLRLMADMDNLRKRLEREKEEAVKYAAATFARDMLTVADNLTRALEAVPEEKRKEGGEFLQKLVEGVEMTLKDLLNTFERHHIRKINSHGEKFDPNYHQAMFEVTDTDADTGTIVQVVQEGYTHHDRVLRPALVGVARREEKKAEQQD